MDTGATTTIDTSVLNREERRWREGRRRRAGVENKRVELEE